MLGKTVLGEQLADARCVVQYLKNLPELDSTQLSFWGASHARRNTADTRFSVPLEVDPAPAFVEPAGGLLALLLGLTEPNRGVLVDRLPVSYLSALDSAILMYPHDSLARNFFAAGDVPDLVQVLAHTPITWREPVDGRQVPLNAAARTRLSDHLVRARGAGKPLRILPADEEGPADVLLERK
jgi:hypothetical protein